MMEYKGYLGTVEYDAQAQIFHGDVVNTRAVIAGASQTSRNTGKEKTFVT